MKKELAPETRHFRSMQTEGAGIIGPTPKGIKGGFV
jgi:hypothetical protein